MWSAKESLIEVMKVATRVLKRSARHEDKADGRT